MNSFLLVAVPLFILVGVLMERGRVAEKLFDFAEAIVGWLPGGLGHVNVASSVIFGGVSGSSVADIASIGVIEIKAMERHGFPKGYAVGLTLCTSVLSSIIPPSILIVIAGSIANASIGTLLVAGLVPGLFIAFAFMVFNHFYSVRYGFNPPTPFNLRRVVTTGLAAILPMLTPVILLVGIVDGYFTPTEAAAIAVLFTMVLAILLYRAIPLSDLPGIFIEVARTSGTILFIAATAKLAAWVFTFDGLPTMVATFLSTLSGSPTVVLVLIFLFLILVGMFMDAIAAMFILIPVLLPSVLSLGIDPIHFLIVTVITLTLGTGDAAGRGLPLCGVAGREDAHRGRHQGIAGADVGSRPGDPGAGAVPGPDARADPVAWALLTHPRRRRAPRQAASDCVGLFVQLSFGTQPFEEAPDLLLTQVIARADDPLGHETKRRWLCDRTDKRPVSEFALHHHPAFQRDPHPGHRCVDRHVASVEEHPAPSILRLQTGELEPSSPLGLRLDRVDQPEARQVGGGETGGLRHAWSASRHE